MLNPMDLFCSSFDGTNDGTGEAQQIFAFAGDVGAGVFPLLRAFKDGNTILGLACFLNIVIWTVCSVCLLYTIHTARTLEKKIRARCSSSGSMGQKRHLNAQDLCLPFVRQSMLGKSFTPQPMTKVTQPEVYQPCVMTGALAPVPDAQFSST